jgi:aquaporin Z
MKKYLAECIGTFALVFFGTGAIVVNEHTNGDVGIVGIALAFGLIIIAMIYTFGAISGAHINPAVTISFALDKKISVKDTLFYIVFQVIGAILASLVLHILFPNNQNLGTTFVSGTVWQSFIMEVIATFFMMLTIYGSTQNGPKKTKAFAGIVIGFTVLGLIFVAGPISGGSFNPARSLGPALVSGNLQHLWLYLSAPILGTVFALFVWKTLRH